MGKYRELRNRIKGVSSTAQITSAMKMVAASKLRRAQEAITFARPYGMKLRDIIQSVASNEEGASANPLFEEREIVRVCLVVIAADRGLCGAFNSNLCKQTLIHINTHYSKQLAEGNLDIICVGKRSVEFFTKRKMNVVQAYPGFFSNLNFSESTSIASTGFLNRDYDRVEVIYNMFKSAIKQVPTFDQFLPIKKFVTDKTLKQRKADYIFEPSKIELLDSLLPKQLNTQFWNSLLDSNAAEHAARMTSMENATQNARELVRSLTLQYNKARQSAITTEMLEIVSGAEALNN
jgi:F-type H+-transporting ATPase subunit gamma